jgi:hypothetical protein
VIESPLQKARELEKGHQSENLERISHKCLMILRSQKNGKFEGYGENYNWTHKSCLWELPYVKALILPHNIDLMHQERNVAESIISMCLDVTGFSKDNINARKDLATLCDCPLLEVKTNIKGNLTRPRVPYYLKPAEKKRYSSG